LIIQIGEFVSLGFELRYEDDGWSDFRFSQLFEVVISPSILSYPKPTIMILSYHFHHNFLLRHSTKIIIIDHHGGSTPFKKKKERW